jgi:prevent-host-death family protein
MVKYKARSRKALARIAATEASKNFGRLVDRVRDERATYIIERSGKPVAQIGPIDQPFATLGDFKAWIRNHPPADEDYLKAVEAVVALHNKPRVRWNPWER